MKKKNLIGKISVHLMDLVIWRDEPSTFSSCLVFINQSPLAKEKRQG